MSENRRRKREIKRQASKKIKVVDSKQERIRESVMRSTGQDPFEEISEFKKYWFIKYFKTGLKMFPTHTYRAGTLMVRFNLENLYLAWFGYVLKIKNWKIRNNKKPRRAIGRYLITLRKNKRPYEP